MHLNSIQLNSTQKQKLSQKIFQNFKVFFRKIVFDKPHSAEKFLRALDSRKHLVSSSWDSLNFLHAAGQHAG